MLDRGAGDTTTVVVVALPPEIHASYARYAFDPLYAAITCGAPLVIADLSATVAWDLVSAYGLLRVRDWATARQVEFRLVIPAGAPLRRVLELVGIDHLLEVYPSVAEAARPRFAPTGPHPVPPYPPWSFPDGELGA
jgi:hypothetical protein